MFSGVSERGRAGQRRRGGAHCALVRGLRPAEGAARRVVGAEGAGVVFRTHASSVVVACASRATDVCGGAAFGLR
eukprot:2226128-Pyramimonas_sp.AAC.1